MATALTDLNTVTKEEFLGFINSFDTVFSDIDGVLTLTHTLIPGADLCLNQLKKLGKNIVYITNNSAESAELVLQKRLKPFEAQDKELFSPIKATLAYLKNLGYDKSKSLYVVGSPALTDALKENGYTLIGFEPPLEIEESLIVLRDICLEAKETASKIGGVIIDYDYNFTFVKGVRATVLLRANPDMLFLSGLSDRKIVLGDNINIIGSGCYIQSIERVAKRKSVQLAKPGTEFGKMLNLFHEVKIPGKVLFIGDSIPSDMAFATNCGYQKLLVLSGTTQQEDIKNWPASEDLKPQYYVNSLNDFYELLNKFL